MYTKFIEKYRNQVIDINEYYEKHHIVPKHCGGTNEITNLIRLTYRQHILAHLLLYRKYNRLGDLIAYRFMKNTPIDRKIEVCKIIGQNNIDSGHIIRLGLKNKETNFINTIKTTDSLKRGGVTAGNIAKTTGQILSIKTKESTSKGGRVSGNLLKDKGYIQEIGKHKGKYIIIVPDGTEFDHLYQAAEYVNLDKKLVNSRSRHNRCGFSRRVKTEEELARRYTELNLKYGFGITSQD